MLSSPFCYGSGGWPVFLLPGLPGGGSGVDEEGAASVSHVSCSAVTGEWILVRSCGCNMLQRCLEFPMVLSTAETAASTCYGGYVSQQKPSSTKTN